MSNAAAGLAGQYYRHSGRFSGAGAVKALLIGALVGVPLGVVYAYVDLYIPIGGWVTFLITGGTGFLLGWIIGAQLKSGKVRNAPMAMMIALVVAGLMYVVSWEAYLYALLAHAGHPVPLGRFLANPVGVWGVLKAVNEHGVWSIHDATPSGIVLDFFWVMEAGALLGIPLAMARRAVNEQPFCEKCDKWGATRDLVDVKAGSAAEVKGKLEAREFDVLPSLGKAPPGSMHFWHVYFQGCADCDTTQTLCIDDFTLSVDKNGKLQTSKKKLITRLMLTPEDTVAVATAVAALSVPEKVLEIEKAPADASNQNAAAGSPKTEAP